MTFPVLARAVHAALSDPRHTSIDFAWHGGETTLLPISFYEKAMVLQSNFRRPGQTILNGIQTNGTRLTPEWVRFFKDNDFKVGVSLDGPPEIHDAYRHTISGGPSFVKAVAGIQLLKEFDVDFVTLMVIDEAAIRLGAGRIFDFFLENGLKDIGFIPVKPLNQAVLPVSKTTAHYTEPETMSKFLCDMYDRWLQHRSEGIYIRELDAIEKQVRGSRSGLCTLAGNCFGHFYLIEPNGEVAHCDLFLGDERYTLGNIVTNSFEELRSSPKMASLEAQNAVLLRELSDCPEYRICNGGCPHERYLSTRHNLFHTDACCGLKSLICHVRQRMNQNTPESMDNRA